MKYIHNIFIDYPDVVDVSTMAQMLKIGKTKAYDLLKTNQLYFLKVGSTYRIPKNSIIDFIMSEV